ncbi:hypothetical protein RI129_000508 [Pyrocoelia pectoralis]|uniref:Aminopeptidase n=1 Tax=Pyrocoelia pectoralis TaxID=417401 RepID=A0AAN7VRQ6_9COLE
MLGILIAVVLTGQFLANPVNGISYRLPQEVKPLKYHLEMRPDFENNIFTGDVAIQVKAIKDANTITLNQLELIMPPKEAIEVVGMTTKDTVTVESVGPGESVDQQFFVITLAAPLIIGHHYLVKIPNFEGTFNTPSQFGFYYAHYLDENGINKKFATTQFEPVFARKAFPCFDEPALKANFRLVIKRPSNVFEETDLMSTYLVAFIVSEMQFSETLDKHRVLAPKAELEKGRHLYSLNRSYHALSEMEKYTGIPYTFKKVDHASIPTQYYNALAMENWGLITYREDMLLVSPDAEATYKQQVVSTIAHEIGHQYFGNLVSPEWWDYIWLNEGFANYFQHYLAHKVEPDMDFWKIFNLISGLSALIYDGNPVYSRPMNRPVEIPNQIYPLFDVIAYKKAGAVIRMLENMVSSKVFQQGLIYYLGDRQFKGATPHDLYKNFQRALNESSENRLPPSMKIEDIMTTWDSVSGFPLVTVTRNYGSLLDNVQLKQRAFNNNNNQGNVGGWIIPINYATKCNSSFESTDPQEWLINSTKPITVPNLGDDDWLIVNVQQSGYYRVNYDERNWALIADVLMKDHRIIHPFNRAKLLDDCLHMGVTGDISPNVCAKLEEYVVNEDDPFVLMVIKEILANIDNKLYYAKGRNYFKDRVIYLLQGAYNRLTFDEQLNDKPSDNEARTGIIFWLCKMGHYECKSKTLAKFKAWKHNEGQISPDMQSAIFCGAMRSNNQNDFDYLFSLFTETTDHQFKTRLASGLACVEDEKSLERVLQYSFNQRSPVLLEHVIKTMHGSSKTGQETVLDFVAYNVGSLQEILGDQIILIIEELATQTYSANHLKKLSRTQLRTTSANIFERALATIANNAEWLNKNEHKLLESMRNYRK